MSLPLTSAPAPSGAFCAVHAERTAATLCHRCGNYACASCFQAGHDQRDYCLSCLSRVKPALAERSTRLAATIVDNAVLFGPGLLCGIIGGVLAAMRGSSGGVTPILVLLGVGGLAVLGAMAWQLYLLATVGQSVGKRMLGIKVVRTDGGPVELSRLIILRNLVPTIIDMPTGNFFGLVDKLVIFTEQRRCLHDYIADTQVIVVPESE